MIIKRETAGGSNDLNVVYRPCTVDEVLGNATNKKIIKNALDTGKASHAYLFTGEAGTGKTTMARIVALGLNCEKGISATPCLECPSCKSILEGSNMDVKEINVGQEGGKAYVNSVIQDLSLAPFRSRYKVIIFDEAHELSTAAKDLLLKPLENGYSHVYFIFCTNQPEKLESKRKEGGEPFLRRFSIFNFTKLSRDEVFNLLKNICEFEGAAYNKAALEIIAEESCGISGNAIMLLDKTIKESSWDENVVREICKASLTNEDPQLIELCVALNKGIFKGAVDIYAKLSDLNVETVRITVAGYFASCLRRSKKVPDARKYSAILDIVTQAIYEPGKLADHKWVNYMFKITDIINTTDKVGK